MVKVKQPANVMNGGCAMTVREETGSAVVVPLAAEIDLTNSERACGELDAALASGAAVVIADLSSTRFCDCASLRGLLGVQRRAASRGRQLRLVIPAGSPVRRLASLTGLDELLHSYPSVREAATWLPPSVGSVQPCQPGGPGSALTASSSVR
jgi:anti-anti-sigma factor